MMRRRLAASLLSGILAISLAACGGGASPQSDEQGSGESSGGGGVSEGGSISLAIWDTYQEKGISDILEQFTTETGITVNVEVTPWDQYWTMLEAGATGGSLPDVFWMHSNQAARYMRADMLMDLTGRIEASDVSDLSKFPPDITALYTYDGKVYAVPKDMDTIALWYNKTMFDEAGIDYPDDSWTWDTLKEAARQLTNGDGQYGFVCNARENQTQYYNFIYQNGGRVISEDHTVSGWDDPKTIEAIEFFCSFVEEGLSPDVTTTAENTHLALFESGIVAMGYFGSWSLTELAGNEYVAANCDLAPLPAANDGTKATIYNGLGWSAAANTGNPEAAWALIEFLSSGETQLKLSETGIAISCYEGTADAWTGSRPELNLHAYTDQIPYAVFRPYSVNSVVWEDMTIEKMSEALSGVKPAADICREIAEEMNKFLAEE